MRENGSDGVRHGTARLRLSVHLLHRPAHPRAGAEPPAGGCGAGGGSSWRRRAPREVTLLGQTVNSYHDGEHDFADLLRAVGAVDGIRRVRFTSPYPTDFTPRVIEAMADTRRGVRARAPAGAERLQRGAEADAAPLHARAVSRGRGAAPGGHSRHHLLDRHHRRVPGRDRGAVPGDAEPGRRRRFRRRLHLQVLGPRGHAGHPAATITLPDEVGSERLERLIETVRPQRAAQELARVGEVHEVLVERRAKRGELMLAAPGRIISCWWISPPTSVGEYHRVRLTGTTGSTFTGAVVTPALAVL